MKLITALICCALFQIQSMALPLKFQPIPDSFEPMTDQYLNWQHTSHASPKSTPKSAALIHLELDVQQRSEKLSFIFNHKLPKTRVIYDKKRSRLLVHLSHGQDPRVKLSHSQKISQKSALIQTIVAHPALSHGFQSIELVLSQPVVFSPHIPSSQSWKLTLHLAKKQNALH